MDMVSLQDPWVQLSEVVRLVRTGRAQTRPELSDALRLGRNVITQRIQTAQELGLVRPSGSVRSRGGRAADIWEFRGDSGRILLASFGSTTVSTFLTTLTGDILARAEVEWDLEENSELILGRVAGQLHTLLAADGAERAWGICIGTLAPIEFPTGRSADPVALSAGTSRALADVDVRSWFAREFDTPTWTDSIINLATLGAATAPDAPPDMVYVRIGYGLGCGLISEGRLHRGSTWIAGELNHITMSEDPQRICACGRVGCLETYSSGRAILGDGVRAVSQGDSPFLSRIAETRSIELDDISAGVQFGDQACVEIVVRAGEMLGKALATLITLFNPARLTIGGFPISRNGLLQRVVERTIRANTLAASVAALDLAFGDADQSDLVSGGVELVTNSLLAPEYLAEWGPRGTPTQTPELRLHSRQVG